VLAVLGVLDNCDACDLKGNWLGHKVLLLRDQKSALQSVIALMLPQYRELLVSILGLRPIASKQKLNLSVGTKLACEQKLDGFRSTWQSYISKVQSSSKATYMLQCFGTRLYN